LTRTLAAVDQGRRLLAPMVFEACNRGLPVDDRLGGAGGNGRGVFDAVDG